MLRKVQAETLDGLAPDNPQAIGSRADLVRLHHVMGTVSILRAGLTAWGACANPGRPLKILELGAGDGSLLLRVAAVLAPRWPRVELTLLDRQPLVSAQTVAGYARLGWTATPMTVDALEWAKVDAGSVDRVAKPAPGQPGWDIVIANLFLHHFATADLATLLHRVAACSDRFFACEPRRSRFALAASHLVGAIGANVVTREDAVLSVHAGFRENELSAAWPASEPGQTPAWQLDEYPARLFSHCFRAARRAHSRLDR